MSHLNVYIIDSSSLIYLRRHNPIDIYEKPWEKLSDLISENRLITHSEVKKEITDGNDFLAEWFKEQDKNHEWVCGITDYQVEKIPEIHAKYPKYIKPDNKNDADPFIIALSLEKKENPQTTLFGKNNYTLITNEKKKNHNLNNSCEVIAIPDFCEIYSIECIDVLGCFRKEGWKF